MKFEKVSVEEFKKACNKYTKECKPEWLDYFTNKMPLPTRSDKGSAGYDFYSPINCELCGGNTFIPTGIKVKLDSDKLLAIFPRSSCAKHYYQLGNQTGIIDSSYYNNDSNEGHILVCLRTVPLIYPNYPIIPNSFEINVNDRIAQGIILPFFTVDEDIATGTRSGGFGSTGK